MSENKRDNRRNLGRALGLGIITGAADDDPSAIGTYASAPARNSAPPFSGSLRPFFR